VARDVLRPAGDLERSEAVATTSAHIRDVLAALVEMEGRLHRLRTLKGRLDRPQGPGIPEQ
jgi:hypothetical protein